MARYDGEKGRLTAKTQTGPSVERQISPADVGRKRTVFPSLRMELRSVGAIEVGSTVHVVNGIRHTCSTSEEDGGKTVGTTATGKEGSFDG
jgi:hypothetical protein